jgi:hypothetical protein
MIHKNYCVPICHPATDEIVDSIVDFDYYPGSVARDDEPPDSPEVYLVNCRVDDEDIYDLLEISHIYEIESLLLSMMLSIGEDNIKGQMY